MDVKEVAEIVRVKYKTKERCWSVAEGDGAVYIFANFAYKGTARPLRWKDKEVIDTIDGIPVIFQRMDITIGGDD